MVTIGVKGFITSISNTIIDCFIFSVYLLNNCYRKFSSLMIDSGGLSIIHNSSYSKSVVGVFSNSVSLITDSDLNIGGRTQQEE